MGIYKVFPYKNEIIFDTRKILGYHMFMVMIATDFMKKGYRAGNDLVKEILALGVSKYRMAKDLKVERQTVYNWYYGHFSPDEHNYSRLKEYLLYWEKKSRIRWGG